METTLEPLIMILNDLSEHVMCVGVNNNLGVVTYALIVEAFVTGMIIENDLDCLIRL